MNKTTLRAAVLLAGATIAFTACSDVPEEGRTGSATSVLEPPAAQAEAPIMLRTRDLLAPKSLAENASASSLILVGRIVGEEQGIMFGTGPGQIAYTAFTVEPSRVMKGSAANSIRVLMVTETVDGRTAVMEGRPTPNEEESVWLLNPIAEEFKRPGEYVLTSVVGVIPGQDGKVVAEGAEYDPPALVEAQRLGSIDKLANYLASLKG